MLLPKWRFSTGTKKQICESFIKVRVRLRSIQVVVSVRI